MAQQARTAQPVSVVNGPGISDDILRAVEVLEDQLEQVLGPRPFPKQAEIRNVNRIAEERMTLGQRVADRVAATIGSWPFIIIQSIFLTGWIILNVVAWVQHWDPYPFILLNLALSFQAAYSAPIIMMSQNRQNAKDRLSAEEDFRVNRIAEDEIRAIMAHLERQDQIMLHILERLERHRLLAAHDRAGTHPVSAAPEEARPGIDAPGGVEPE
jgi:uncharacterized membrane protein